MPAPLTMATIAPEHFLWEIRGKVAIITLNRPEKKNPLTFESYRELTDTFVALQRLREVGAVVITGAGGNFCSGGDVHDIIGRLVEMKHTGDDGGLMRFTQMTGNLVKAMRACPQPIVAAVDGVCVGAGAILAMASDIRVGTSKAKVAFLFVRVGLSGADMGACAILPRLIGFGRAADLLFTGRTIEGEEAERWGFFTRLSTPEALQAEALELARSLGEGPTAAHAITKKCMHDEWAMEINEALDNEARKQAEAMKTDDFERAYRAFVDKRAPKFEGN